MGNEMKVRRIGILTAGGDCPGLNAAIRGVAKPLQQQGVEIIGFLDGFRGLVENRYRVLGPRDLSGLLIQGGTILGTSRFKPHKFLNRKGKKEDRTEDAVATVERLKLDALVCIGGGGTLKNAHQLYTHGVENILHLPKTIDNDVYGTDVTFGYDSAMSIACDAIDRLHTTASSHHRCMFVDIMGHNTGWLALSAGIAGGADVILLPEFPYSEEKILEALTEREAAHKRFSIIAVAEGAVSQAEAKLREAMSKEEIAQREDSLESVSQQLSRRVEAEMGMDCRITSLGHLQRGGIPTAQDRILATNMGTRAARAIFDGNFGVMIAARNGAFEAVPFEEVAGKKKYVEADDPLVRTARYLGVSLGI